MHTYLEIVTRPSKGLIYRIRPGMKVGSGEVDLRLADPALPPLHSQILLDHKNHLVMVCTNAVYEILINANSVKKLALLSGATLQIGNTVIRVLTSLKELSDALDPLAPPPPAKNVAQTWAENPAPEKEVSVVKVSPPTPKKLLLGAIKAIEKRVAKEPGTLVKETDFSPFANPLRLYVETGPQADDEFIVTWGPREFGPLALEFPIEYPPFPGILFTLAPDKSGDVIFSTNHPTIVRVCGQNQTTCVIKGGDRIEAGNSTLRIEYLKDEKKNDKG